MPAHVPRKVIFIVIRFGQSVWATSGSASPTLVESNSLYSHVASQPVSSIAAREGKGFVDTEALAPRHMWGCILKLPESALLELESQYAAGFSPDGHASDIAMVDAAAWWHVFNVLWRLPTALEADYRRDESSLRQQLIGWLTCFSEMGSRQEQMSRLRESARLLPLFL